MNDTIVHGSYDLLTTGRLSQNFVLKRREKNRSDNGCILESTMPLIANEVRFIIRPIGILEGGLMYFCSKNFALTSLKMCNSAL